MNIRLWLAVLLAGSVSVARAQFGTAWLHDEKYWGDGKAEFNLYDAQEVRYGAARPSEVIHILVREPFSQRELVKAEAGSKTGTYPVLKLNQILHVPTGLYVYQQMHSAFWRVDSGALIKATLTSNDSCGNTYKEFRALTGAAALFSGGWRYEWRTYWEGASAGEENVAAPKDAVFYDELPMRVRTIDFAKPGVPFAIHLAPSVVRSKKDDVKFVAASVSWSRTGADLVVKVTAGALTDEFLLDGEPPYRLREWRKSDGGKLTLRRSLKIDYWNYNQPDGKARALAQP
jgi:hypothetical protein